MYTLQLTNSYKDEVNKGIWNGTETFKTMRLVIKLRSVDGGRRSWHRNMEKRTQNVMYKNVENKKIGKYALTRNIQM